MYKHIYWILFNLKKTQYILIFYRLYGMYNNHFSIFIFIFIMNHILRVYIRAHTHTQIISNIIKNSYEHL